MDMGTVRGLIAIVTMATFLGICWWAYRGKNRRRFEQDGMIPFEDDRPADSEAGAHRSSGAGGLS